MKDNMELRAELPRIFELRDCIAALVSSNASSYDFDQNFTYAKDYFVRRERELQGLDDQAWKHLKGKAVPRLTKGHQDRGWHQLFDLLNEARAYNYLKSLDCTNLRFIPRSQGKTPELEGSLASDRVLCEVKTINVSDTEIAFRTGPGRVRSRLFPTPLPDAFLNKLDKTLKLPDCSSWNLTVAARPFTSSTSTSHLMMS